MTNTTPSPDPSAPATPSGSGAKEVETYRRRQVTAFRGFVIGIALATLMIGRSSDPIPGMRSIRQSLIGACIVAGVAGFLLIRWYQRQIDLIGRVSGAATDQPPVAQRPELAGPDTANTYATGVVIVGVLAALLHWLLMSWGR